MNVKSNFSNLGFLPQIILIAFFSLSVGGLISMGYYVLYAAISGIPLENLASNSNFLKSSQLISTLSIFAFPSLIMAYLIHQNPFKYLGFIKTSPIQLLLSAASIIAAIPLLQLLIEWNEAIQFPQFLSNMEDMFRSKEEAMHLLTRKLLWANSWTGWFVNLLLAGVAAALCEELFFRGVLQKLILEKSKHIHLAIWATAFIFSAIHLQFYGFIPRVLLGAYFGYLFFWSGSIWIPILAHFTNNAIALWGLYLEQQGIDTGAWFTQTDYMHQTLWVLLSLGTFSALTLLLYKQCKRVSKSTL